MTIKAEELKPCPFCGGNAIEFEQPIYGLVVTCGKDGAAGCAGRHVSVKRELWNTRPADLAVELIEELGEALTYISQMKTSNRIKQDAEAMEGSFGPDYERLITAMYDLMQNKARSALSKLDAWKGRGG